MQSDPLIAISPLDGRYAHALQSLAGYFSEYALIRYRVQVELEWFIFLCNEVKLKGTPPLAGQEVEMLRELSTNFEVADARSVKEFEATTNHDVKAVEYFIKEHFKAYPKLDALAEFIHFGCTSEDINNLSYALMVRDFGTKEYNPIMSGLILELYEMAKKYKKVPMLSHTHGQPASPTTLGKEFINVVARLESQLQLLNALPHVGKMNGAVGNFNAHLAAYPKIDWPGVSVRFVTYLGLQPQLYTTQIEPHDMLAAHLDGVRRLNTILMDFCRDIWTYISLGFFTQKLKKGEVGSSTMPHKVNPIDFENAEGNLGLANTLAQHLANKLPISRMQRDLTDSTVMRNVGTVAGYSLLAYKSLLKGLNKLEVNEQRLHDYLDDHWEVLGEAIQTVLRAHGVTNAYEQLKELTRGKKVNQTALAKTIKKLPIPAVDQKRLLALTPQSYIGAAVKLVDTYKPQL
ncbi:adenylosuccinate lyase [Candidatus Peregrinibacteria bacterium CG11_big_fil_rev_8_21_14_0_20_46_8]|nr:MAG: adenylosuccinate lyase [Candidatus Peregrinibacteria bacterium CG11_big_fil_rev_8_21_14_0_20_46_8]